MNRPLLRRRGVLHAGLGLCAVLAAPSLRANACEFHAPTLRIVHPWTRSTGPDDFAVVSMVFDEVTTPDRLIGVQTAIAAGAELGGPGALARVDLAIPAGQVTELSETGTHLRLTGLRHALEVGRTYELKLLFERGGLVDVHLDVDYERLG